VLRGNCQEDEDCPGQRRCVERLCVVAEGCPGDRFDGLGAVTLRNRSYSDLLLCDGEIDHFLVTLPSDEGLEVSLSHDPSGDLSLEMSAGLPLSLQSDHAVGFEVLGVLPQGEQERLVEIRVMGSRGEPVEYSLDIRREDGCAPDGLEGPFGNDDAEHASLIRSIPQLLRLCPGDEDWLKIMLPVGGVLWLTPEVLAEGDLELSVFNAEMESLLEGRGHVDAPEGGIYYIRARADQVMDLLLYIDIEASAGAAAQACANAIELSEEQPVLFPEHAALVRFGTSCAFNRLADEVLRFELDEESHVRLEAPGRPDASFSLRRECEGEEICGSLGQELRLEAGVWFVVVSHELLAGPLEIRMSSLSARCEGENSCPEGSLCTLDGCRPPCVNIADCFGAQICEEGRCIEPERCVTDIDCLGIRACEAGRCIEPGCELHSDCLNACVNRICEARVPAECDPQQPCPDAQSCTPLGACLLDAPCVNDGDCPEARPYCDAGRCFSCLRDEDCVSSAECIQGRCKFTGVCEQDEDCPGDRICEQIFCMPPACEGDLLDAQGQVTLEARAYSDLILCDADNDLYNLQVPDGEGLVVIMRHAPEHDLRLELREDGVPFAFQISDEQETIERIVIPPAARERRYVLVVKGRAGDSPAYSLDLHKIAAGDCAPDLLEGPHGNDSQLRARAIRLGEQSFSLCEGDEDWFRIRLAAGTRLHVELSHPDLELDLLNEAGETLLQEAGVIDLRAEQEYFFHLRGDPGDYSLILWAEPSPNAISEGCLEAPLLQPGEPLILYPNFSPQLFQISCDFLQGGSSLAYFDLSEPTIVSLDVQGAHFGLAMALRERCEDPNSELICSTTQVGRIENLALEAGRYFVVILNDRERLEVNLLLE